MLLFEFDQGQLFPTRLGWRSPDDIDPEVMGAVRDQVLQLIGRPLFAIQWTGVDGSPAARGEPNRLIAMDGSGQVVSVEVMATLDAVGLVDALARSGRTAALGWMDLADLYPRGAAVFRRDWNVFRESHPPRPIPGPRLHIVAGKISAGVRPALEMLADSGVEVFEVAGRELPSGRRFIEVTEPFRVSVPTLNAYAALQAGRRPDLVLDRDEDLRRLLSLAPDGQNIAADIVETPGAVRPFVLHSDEPRERPTRDVDSSGYPSREEEAPEPPSQMAQVLEPASREDAATGEGVGAADPLLRAIADACGGDTPLVWRQLRRGQRHEALLRADGMVVLPDGLAFADPSQAADVASGRHGVDGWGAWRLTDDGPTLSEALDEVWTDPGRGRRH